MFEPKDFLRIKKPETARVIFRSGDLREVADMVFAPSSDPDIQAGAQELVCMKVNPATQSVATMANAYGNSLSLTSLDYGAYTGQINASVAAGTSKGKLLSIVFEDSVESVDDLGGDVILKVKYVKPTGGWDTMSSQIQADGSLKCLATRSSAGLDTDISGQLSGNIALQVKSSSASDVGLVVTVYGLDASSAAISASYTLSGVTAVPGATVFSKVLGARVAGTTVGTVTVEPSGGGTAVLTLAAGANPLKGLSKASCMYASGALTVVASGASAVPLLLIGYSATGLAQLEKLTLNGTTPVVGTANWSEVTYVALGMVLVATSVTVSGIALLSTAAVQSTVQKLTDYVNAKAAGGSGFVMTLETGLTTLAVIDLDVTTGAQGAVSCLSPAEPSYYADLWAMKNWINQTSVLVTATKATGAKGGAPANTVAAVFLAGGSEGTTSVSDWQNALNLLKKTRVNSIVVLTADPAVHIALDAHCAYMCGEGRSERDGFVGLLNAGLTDVATKAEIKDQIVSLNSRHIRAFGQAFERYNTAGDRQEFPPCFLAAIAAGMQAGSPVGTSLTFKYANLLSLRQHSTWNPMDDAEEMVQAGLCFLESVEGIGRRFVRNVTTHLSSNIIAYCEGSVNEAVNYAVYNFRTVLEWAVGRTGFAGTVNALKAIAINALGLLKDAGVIIDSRSLSIELIVDVMEVSVEIAAAIPVNFVPITVHLNTVKQTAV
jgi:hypothetical protein